jgi:sugar O-acyltransferase (sialic acid O-acetyltransferase NeuD family)
MDKIYIFGSGAQGRVVLDILLSQYPNSSFYFVDDNPEIQGQLINKIEVISQVKMFFHSSNPNIHIAIGNNELRSKLFNEFSSKNCKLINAIHSTAVVVSSATIGNGNMVGIHSIVNSNANIGNGCIINTNVIIEHDSVIEDFSSISPGAVIGGRVNIKEKAFISSNATIHARLEVGSKAIIGMGAVVTKNVENEEMVYGNPAKFIRKVTDSDWSKVL